MKDRNRQTAVRPLVIGLLLFILRMIQNRTGFDPKTGLALPCLSGTVLAVCIALVLVLEYAMAVRLPKEKVPFSQHFAPPQKELSILVVGCLLLTAGGIVFAFPALREDRNLAALVTGVLALCAGGGLLAVTKRLRSGGELSAAPLLPALFFGVFFVLAVYLPEANDPVLARYYLPVLASALAAYAFAQLAGFARGESSTRSFTPTASCAASLCLAATAGGPIGQGILFLGCALIFLSFLSLQRGKPHADSI